MPSPPPSEDVASHINAAASDGWNAAMGVHFVRATADEVVVEWEVGPQHRQPHGIVHGGVHAGVIETIASVGAALYARQLGLSVVGLENHTSFLRAVREGVLRATARPLTRGRRTQVWEGEIRDASGRIVATGRVRLLALEPESTLAGETVGKPPAE
jgi:1,4-dihydroxy-2-naphthoyl-CoA hydrolase